MWIPARSKLQEAYKKVWNQVQKELKCCGVEDVRDWTNCAECGFQPGANFKKRTRRCGTRSRKS